jgi:hypothetical protein
LEVVEHVPPVNALVSAAPFVDLAVLVLVACALVDEDGFVENGSTDAVHTLLLFVADPRRPLTSGFIVEEYRGVC